MSFLLHCLLYKGVARVRTAAAALLLAASAGCTREAINAREQSGVWNIRRVTLTIYNDSTGSVVEQRSSVNSGQVAFVNITGKVGSTDAEARFYIDAPTPSPTLASLNRAFGAPGVGGGTTLVTQWLVDAHERRRVSLREDNADPGLSSLAVYIFTITDETATTQRWQRVTSTRDGYRIGQREEWELEREE